jgi:hypothetical protein
VPGDLRHVTLCTPRQPDQRVSEKASEIQRHRAMLEDADLMWRCRAGSLRAEGDFFAALQRQRTTVGAENS